MGGAVLELPEIVDDLTRRRFLGGLIALGALGGCAADTGSPVAPTATPNATGVRVAHDGGEVTLTQIPSRIVALGSEVVELVVALGIQPVGIGARVVDAARADQAFEGYYLTPAQIGTPRFVGSDPYNLEAIAALQPYLIVLTYESEQSTQLGGIAPTVLYEYWGVSGTWQDSLRRLGAGLEREPQAAAAIAAYEGAVASGRSRLSDVVSKAPRVSVVYPDFRGRGINIVYAAERTASRPLVELGFTVVGVEKAIKIESDGYAEMSTELLGDLETDTILTIGPVDWKETPAAPTLQTVDIPVVWIPSPSTQPTMGPITAVNRLNGYITALLTDRG